VKLGRLARQALRKAPLVSALALSLVSGEARANGRYPAAGQIAVHPKDPKTLLVRATYGIMLSSDGAKTWGWICEPAVGYGNVEDPMMAFTADGTLLAGIFEGLSIGQPNGCTWGFYPPLKDKYVIDLAVDKVDPTKAVLVISNSAGQDDAGQPFFVTQLWQSSDTGKTWAQAGTSMPAQFLALTVDTAPSNPERVYVSGRYGAPNYLGAIERSDDRGVTWQKLAVPGADSTHLPYIGGVDPNDPDVVYVRLLADPNDSLLVSKDGGLTWMTIFTATGKLAGFAISPDGATVAIGGPGIVPDAGVPPGGAGIWTAPSNSLAFTKVSSIGAKCLTWAPGALYACADEFLDKLTAGVSTNNGQTFTPILHLGGLCGPLACDPSTTVGQQCPALWSYTQMSISASCPTSPDAGPHTTSSSSSSNGSTSGGTSSTSSGGCSCTLPPQGAGGLAALSLAAVAALVARERRRRR
jgi:hypothetical protein